MRRAQNPVVVFVASQFEETGDGPTKRHFSPPVQCHMRNARHDLWVYRHLLYCCIHYAKRSQEEEIASHRIVPSEVKKEEIASYRIASCYIEVTRADSWQTGTDAPWVISLVASAAPSVISFLLFE